MGNLLSTGDEVFSVNGLEQIIKRTLSESLYRIFVVNIVVFSHDSHNPFSVFLCLYAVARALIETIRSDHGTAPGEWTVAQMASIPALLLGAWLWLSAPDRKAAGPDRKASSAPTSG
jgi:prolipoprotein diacylglyceryltransferase